MCPVAGIWQAAGATAGLQRPPMRNWSDNHSRVNHFHKLITLEEKKIYTTEGLRHLCLSVRARSVPGERHYLPADGSQSVPCLLLSMDYSNFTCGLFQNPPRHHIHRNAIFAYRAMLKLIQNPNVSLNVQLIIFFINALLLIDSQD